MRSSGAFPGTVSFFVALVFPSFASNSDSVTADLLFLAPGSTFIGNDDGTSLQWAIMQAITMTQQYQWYIVCMVFLDNNH